jgi:hypothetical protein
VLESWGDARAYDGTITLLQPLIEPLYHGKTASQVLSALLGRPGMSSHDLLMQSPDARSLASDEEVGEARRYYRAQCSEHESAAFCDCVTAGVAQALMPAEVRIAARTIGERVTAQGDALVASESDGSFAAAASSAQRIARVEGHYADACAIYR